MTEVSPSEIAGYLEVPDIFLTMPEAARPMFAANGILTGITKSIEDELVGTGGEHWYVYNTPEYKAAQHEFRQEQQLYEAREYRLEPEEYQELYGVLLNAVKKHGYITRREWFPQAWFQGRLVSGGFGMINVSVPRAVPKREYAKEQASLRFYALNEPPGEHMIVPYVSLERKEKVHCKLIDNAILVEASYPEFSGGELLVRMSRESIDALEHLLRQLGTELAPPVVEDMVLSALKKYGGRRINSARDSGSRV